MNTPMTDSEVEQRLFALAAAERAQGEPDMSALIRRALREEYASLMLERRRTRRRVGVLATGTVLAAGALCLQGEWHALTPATPAYEGCATSTLAQLSTPCSQGVTLDLPLPLPGDVHRDETPVYYAVSLESTPL